MMVSIYARLDFITHYPPQNPVSTPGDNRHFAGNFIPATPAGIPVTLAKEVFNTWFKSVQENPQAKGSHVGWELHSPEKWSKVPSDATAYANRNPVRMASRASI